MIKGFYIASFIAVFALVSCKKDPTIYDREDSLDLDTGVVTYRVSYVSHSPTQLEVEVDMLVLNGLNSETGYGSYSFDDPTQENFNMNMTNVSTSTEPSVGSYSTTILLNLGGADQYKYENMGVYLRRFFEIADSLPNRYVAFSTFDAANNTAPRFHRESSSSIFANSWQYNVNTYYDLTTLSGFSQANTNGLYLKNQIFSAIDTMVLEGASGDRSITLISDNDNYSFSNQNDLDTIIGASIANNIRINLIGRYFTQEMHQIAGETGGFVVELRQDYFSNPNPPGEAEYVPSQVGLQNLDMMLKRNVTVHRCNVILTQQGANTFNSGEIVDFNLSYNQKRVNIKLELP